MTTQEKGTAQMVCLWLYSYWQQALYWNSSGAA